MPRSGESRGCRVLADRAAAPKPWMVQRISTTMHSVSGTTSSHVQTSSQVPTHRGTSLTGKRWYDDQKDSSALEFEVPESFFDKHKPWFTGLKYNMERKLYQKNINDGKTMDYSPTPIYFDPHILDVNQAYSMYGNKEAASRKFCMSTCAFFGGRSSELGFLTWQHFSWDPHFQCVVAELPQSKTSKSKQGVICAGKTRHHDWFLSSGDYLATHRVSGDNPDELGVPMWMLPELHTSNRPGKPTHPNPRL